MTEGPDRCQDGLNTPQEDDMRGSQYQYHLSTLPPVLGPTIVGRFFSRIGIKILGGL